MVVGVYYRDIRDIRDIWGFPRGADPRAGEITAALWVSFYNHVEAEMREGRALAELRDVGSKAAEMAARISGVLALVADPRAGEITAETMADAVKLTTWYLDEATRLASAPRGNPKLQAAQLMLEWLQREGRTEISVREAQRLGPNSLREKARILSTFTVLKDHGWLTPKPGHQRRWLVQPEGPA